MSTPTPRDVERMLQSMADQEPPDGLLEKIKATVPEVIPTADASLQPEPRILPEPQPRAGGCTWPGRCDRGRVRDGLVPPEFAPAVSNNRRRRAADSSHSNGRAPAQRDRRWAQALPAPSTRAGRWTEPRDRPGHRPPPPTRSRCKPTVFKLRNLRCAGQRGRVTARDETISNASPAPSRAAWQGDGRQRPSAWSDHHCRWGPPSPGHER